MQMTLPPMASGTIREQLVVEGATRRNRVARDLGFGRIDTSEKEAPNMLVNLV
jgi:hypothetical protein